MHHDNMIFYTISIYDLLYRIIKEYLIFFYIDYTKSTLLLLIIYIFVHIIIIMT